MWRLPGQAGFLAPVPHRKRRRAGSGTARPGSAVPWPSTAGWCGSWAQQGFDGAALVHRLVALGALVERQVEVEDRARVDRAGPDAVDQIGQEPPHRCGTAKEPDV